MNGGSARAFPLLLLASALMTRSAPARAQAQDGDEARETRKPGEASGPADNLFEQGRQAMASGDCKLARIRFEASYQADPAVGTLLNLAVCEEKMGLWNAAVDHLRVGLERVGDGDKRRPSISSRLEDLRARVPHITLLSKEPVAASITLFLDGNPIDAANLGIPLPVDPGRHAIRCEGQRGNICRFEFDAHERKSLEWWIELDSPSAPAPTAAPPRAEPRVAPRRPGPFAWWAGGLGLASFAVGLVAGAEVLHSKGTMAQHCDATGCDPDGMAAASSGRTWSWVSTLATGAGVVGLGAAAWVSLAARPAQIPAAEIAVHGRF